MRQFITFILLFIWISSCAPTSKKHRKHYRKAFPVGQSVQKQKLKPSRSKPTSRVKTPVIHDSLKTSLLPSILNKQDQSLMILIDTGKHLTRKRNLSTHGNLDQKKISFLNLAAFYIDRTEVTVTQFRKYQSQYTEKPFTNGKECPNCPAMGINWFQASKYCRWAGKRLPNEEEWEAAARGMSNVTYPWGDVFLPQHSNLHGKKDGYLFAAPVGSFPLGASSSGPVDMSGNVWEWVDNKKSSRVHRNTHIIKGGGWTSNKDQARISFRNHVDPKMKNPTFGFRCIKPLAVKR